MSIIVTGSLAYDYIMDFPGQFRDHILPEKVHMLSVSFLVDSMKRMRGGVAGNIAYNLALLGERPRIVATAGQDFAEYRAWLEKAGVDASGVREVPDEFTASCFINTDRSNNQIVAFYPGAMTHAKDLTLKDRQLTSDDLVVISPTDPVAIVRYASECRALGVPYVFDPGKQTPQLEKAQILAGLDGCAVLVGNDYEFGMMSQKLAMPEKDLIAAAPLTVVTLGEGGSLFYVGGAKEALRVPIAPVESVVDPTGAGDAFLAGLVYGYARGLPHEVTGRLGALVAAYCIEHRGCQEHTFLRADFRARYHEAFGDHAALAALG